MQIFVRNAWGNTTTLEVESYETISTVTERFKEKEEIPGEVFLRFIYAGKLLEDEHTIAYYNILKHSTLHLSLSDTGQDYSKKTGIPPYMDLDAVLFNIILDDIVNELEAKLPSSGAAISKFTQLNLNAPPRGDSLPPAEASEQAPLNNLSENPVPQVNSRQTKRAWPATQTTSCTIQSAPSQLTQLNVTSQFFPLASTSEQAPLSTPPAPQQAKRTRPATETTSREATPNSHSIVGTSNGEACAEYLQGLASSSDHHAMSDNSYDAKLKLFVFHHEKATEALHDLLPEMRDGPPPSLLTELEDLKHALATTCSDKEELEDTVSELTQVNKALFDQCASYKSQIVALEAQNKKTEEALTVAHSKENDLKATVSELKLKDSVFTIQHAFYEGQIIASASEAKKAKEELLVARSKEKEHEATISKLTHKNKVFSAQCASYESQIIALEVENRTTKEDKDYYARARGAAYAEGLKEGNAKLLKSVEFLHHLTESSMQYFDHGFDSCRKQAEEQGFVGELNKESALKEAPELKGWEECRALPE